MSWINRENEPLPDSFGFHLPESTDFDHELPVAFQGHLWTHVPPSFDDPFAQPSHVKDPFAAPANVDDPFAGNSRADDPFNAHPDYLRQQQVIASLKLIAGHLKMNTADLAPEHIDLLMHAFEVEHEDFSLLTEGSALENELEKKIHLVAQCITSQHQLMASTGIDLKAAQQADLYVRQQLRKGHATSGITQVVFGKPDQSVELILKPSQRLVFFKKATDEVLGRGTSKTAVAAKAYFSQTAIAILKPHANVTQKRVVKKIDLFSQALARTHSQASSHLEQPPFDQQKPALPQAAPTPPPAHTAVKGSFHSHSSEGDSQEKLAKTFDPFQQANPQAESPPDYFDPFAAPIAPTPQADSKSLRSHSSGGNSQEEGEIPFDPFQQASPQAESSPDYFDLFAAPIAPTPQADSKSLRSHSSGGDSQEELAKTFDPFQPTSSQAEGAYDDFNPFTSPTRFSPNSRDFSPDSPQSVSDIAPEPLSPVTEPLLPTSFPQKKLSDKEIRAARELEFQKLFSNVPGLASSILIDEENKELYQRQMAEMRGLLTDTGANRQLLLQIARDAAKGLGYLHDHNYIHRDIKPENILYADQEGALSDFESVCSLDETQELAKLWSTLDYIAPELASSPANASKASDIWAFGMVLYEMTGKKIDTHPAFNGKYDFPVNAVKRQLASLREDPQSYEKAYPEPTQRLSLEHLAWQCTRPDPKDRPSIDQVVQGLQQIWS